MDPPPSGLADATFELDRTTRSPPPHVSAITIGHSVNVSLIDESIYHITRHEPPAMSFSQSEAGPSTLATPRLPARAPPRSDRDKLVEILAFIQSLGLSFPRFLNLMFTVEPKGQGRRCAPKQPRLLCLQKITLFARLGRLCHGPSLMAGRQISYAGTLSC